MAALELAPLLPRDFEDPEARAQYTELMDELSQTGSGVEAGAAALGDEDAERLARVILDLDEECRPLWSPPRDL